MNLRELAEEMRIETLEAGVKLERYDRIVVLQAEKFPDVVLDFLTRVYNSLYKEVVNVRRLITADMWALYKVTPDSRHLKEQQLLSAAQYKLKLIWKRLSPEFAEKLHHGPTNPLPYEYLLKEHKNNVKQNKTK